jgi:hypothetical protein
MSEATSRLNLPLMAAGQSQKEMTHNEALLRIDLLVQAVVMSGPQSAPPTNPLEGQSWIVGKFPTGIWVGKEDYLVQWTRNGWLFVPPFEGLSAWAVTGGRSWRFGAGRWSDALEASSVRIAGTQVIGPQQPPIAIPQGGTNPDTEARTAISMVINSLRAHGLISN